VQRPAKNGVKGAERRRPLARIDGQGKTCVDQSSEQQRASDALAKKAMALELESTSTVDKQVRSSKRTQIMLDDGSISLADLAFSMDFEDRIVRFEGWTSTSDEL